MSFDVYGYVSGKLPWVKQGSNEFEIHGPCPFHDEPVEKRGRLYVNINPDADPLGLFVCHRCGESGAINKLRKFFGDPVLTDAELSGTMISDVALDIYKEAAAYCYGRLFEDRNIHALTYLRENRGLSDETIDSAMLGWCDGFLTNHLRKKGFDDDALLESGLMRENGRDRFLNEITIPYFMNGNVIDIRSKDIIGKYKTLPGKKVKPYNVDSLAGETVVVVCEGEFDALIAGQLRIRFCWGAWSRHLAGGLECSLH